MSKNPPVVTKKQRKKMVNFICKALNEWPRRNVSEGLVEFAERKRVLVSGTSARPGPYRFEITPYLREPAECASEYSTVTELVVMKGTQTGGTDGIMMNHELYCINYGIGPVQYITSDDDLAGEHMEKRIDPMITAAGMQDLITPPVQKKSNKATGDTKRSKSFKGTFLRTTGARSESKLSSLPSRVLHIDEIDKYLVKFTDGGNPVEKAVRRTDSYGALKKIIYISTPKAKATSQIEPLFNQGDMRYYYIKCPDCGTYQKLEWNRIVYEKDKDGNLALEYDDNGNLLNNPVYMRCLNKDCDKKFRDYEKAELLQEEAYGGNAKWMPTKKPDRPGLRSYHISALYGFRSWIDIVIQWIKIDGDETLLMDFTNDTLGETYSEKVAQPDEHYLAARAETDWHRGQVPEGVKIISMGVDVQGDRVEACIMGYGKDMESWAIDYYVFSGNTNDPNDDCWNRLEDLIYKEWKTVREDKSLKISICLVDAPYENNSVMAFCERFPYNGTWQGVFPCYGKRNIAGAVKDHTSTILTPELLMDDQVLKKSIYNCLRLKLPRGGHNYPRGFIHFPSEYPEDYYKQLTSEEVVPIVNKKGENSYEIHNTKQRRNEVLDTMKMTKAGIYYTYIVYFRLHNKRLKQMQKKEIKPDWRLFWNQFE